MLNSFAVLLGFWIRSYCYCTSNVQNESLYFKTYFWSLVWAHRNVCALLYCQLYPLLFWWHSCLVVSWWDTLHTLTLWDDIKHKSVTSMLLGIEGCPQDHIFSFLPHICNQSLFKGILLLFKGKWYLESSILTLLLGVVSRSPGRWHILCMHVYDHYLQSSCFHFNFSVSLKIKFLLINCFVVLLNFLIYSVCLKIVLFLVKIVTVF